MALGYVNPSIQQQEELRGTIAAFLEHCEARGAPLAMLVGDMNMTRQQAPRAGWLDMCQWTDVSDLPPCLAGKTPRRIDWMVSSRALQQRLVAKQLRWDTGLSTHAWQAVDITRGVPSLYTQWVPPTAYPDIEVTAQELSAAAVASCNCYADDW